MILRTSSYFDWNWANQPTTYFCLDRSFWAPYIFLLVLHLFSDLIKRNYCLLLSMCPKQLKICHDILEMDTTIFDPLNLSISAYWFTLLGIFRYYWVKFINYLSVLKQCFLETDFSILSKARISQLRKSLKVYKFYMYTLGCVTAVFLEVVNINCIYRNERINKNNILLKYYTHCSTIV